jgi:hypothetical protein
MEPNAMRGRFCTAVFSDFGMRGIVTLLPAIILVGCGAPSGIPEDKRPDVDWGVLAKARDDGQQISWREDVQPIMARRCVVCHGCFDAPCQLKLSSFDGLIRGASESKVYDGIRIFTAEPTRLNIDATTPEEWRTKGFYSVVGEDQEQSTVDGPAIAAERLRDSVLYRMLRLKQLNPQPKTGLLPDAMTLSLDRKQVCTKQGDMAEFQRDHPLWGMPYAMPNLSDDEYATLVTWLSEGAKPPPALENSAEGQRQVDAWDKFLNGPTNRERLMSRYLYEHLFLGHMHFDGTPANEFYRLVRSSTPPGQPIVEIPTTRPFDDPGTEEFWYRLRRYDATIVAKSHVLYQLSDAKMERYRELFLAPDYEIAELPGYVLPDSANPIKTFADMPMRSRHKFLLDNARFFIQGFIKGPVCRGQVALNVIEDHYWVVFISPDFIGSPEDQESFKSVADYMQMPSSTQAFDLFAAYDEFWEKQKEFLAAKTKYMKEHMPKTLEAAEGFLWRGDGTNPNAALTIFRNFDSAAVEFGLVGDYPETAWVISFSLLERIHYLLVAGFDVYGNLGHQLNTRLFMDFLRMEGEDAFLLWLPRDQRKSVRDKWYQGLRSDKKEYFEEPLSWMDIESPFPFKTTDYQRELYQLIEAKLGPMTGGPDYLNRCTGDACVSTGKTERVRQADGIMRQLAQIKGQQLKVFPDVAYVRVLMEGEEDVNYSLVYNKQYLNVNSLLESEAEISKTRDRDADTLTVIRGFSGSYPNFFFEVPFQDLHEFVAVAANLSNIDQYHAFAGRWGVRRTNSRFWATADWFNEEYARQQPLEAGVLDLSRYANR